MCSSPTRRVLRLGLQTVVTSSTRQYRQSERRCNLGVSHQGRGGGGPGGGPGGGGVGGGGPG